MKTNDFVLSELSKVYEVVLALLVALGISDAIDLRANCLRSDTFHQAPTPLLIYMMLD